MVTLPDTICQELYLAILVLLDEVRLHLLLGVHGVDFRDLLWLPANSTFSRSRLPGSSTRGGQICTARYTLIPSQHLVQQLVLLKEVRLHLLFVVYGVAFRDPYSSFYSRA